MGLSLRDISKKVWDQVNPLDNGRTYQNQTPVMDGKGNPRSIIGQLSHNATTNQFGNIIGKPFVINPVSILAETGRMGLADATQNVAAQQAGQQRQLSNFKQSIPGQIFNIGYKIGSVPGRLTAATIEDMRGNHGLADISRTNMLRDINETPIGGAVAPAQRAIAQAAALGRNDVTDAAGLESVGIDPKASFGKQMTDSAASILALEGFTRSMGKPGKSYNLNDKVPMPDVKAIAGNAKAVLEASKVKARAVAEKAVEKNRAYRARIKADEGGFIAGPLALDFKKNQTAGQIFEGADGKPRFEVDDSGSTYKVPKNKVNTVVNQAVKAVDDVKNQKAITNADNTITKQEFSDIVDSHRRRFGDENVQKGTAPGNLGEYTYHNDMIKIAEGHPDVIGTHNHESVHKAMGQFLNDAEIEGLYQDIIKTSGGKLNIMRKYQKAGYDGITWRGAAEEAIANNFADFMKNGKVKIELPGLFHIIKAKDWAESRGLPPSVGKTMVNLYFKINEVYGNSKTRQAAAARLGEFYKRIDNNEFADATRNTERPTQKLTPYGKSKVIAGHAKSFAEDLLSYPAFVRDSIKADNASRAEARANAALADARSSLGNSADTKFQKTAKAVEDTVAPSNKVSLKETAKEVVKERAPDSEKLLNIKINKAKDATRRAELIAERDARFPKTELPPVEQLKEPSTFSSAWKSTTGVISEYGEHGRAIADALHERRFQSRIGQAEFITNVKSVLDLSEEQLARFQTTMRRLEAGKKTSIPADLKQAVTDWTNNIPKIRDRAVNTDIDVGNRGKFYLPENISDMVRNPDAYTTALAKAEGITKGEAVARMRQNQKLHGKMFGNLEKSRNTNMKGDVLTHKALVDYITGSYDRITYAEQFGAKDSSKLMNLRAKMQKQGYNIDKGSKFDKALTIALEETDKSSAGYKLSQTARNFNAARSLSTSAITNATQMSNTAVIAGVGRTLKGIAKALVSKDARESAFKSGATLSSVIDKLAEGGVGTKSVLRSIASPFFNTVEKFNRTATAVVAEDWANALFKKAKGGDEAATALLREKLGVTGELGESLTREQISRAQHNLVEKSQFYVDPMDLPGWTDTPLGKLSAQYHTFGYKQTGFIWNEVLREAQTGNFAPMIRYVTVGVPVAGASTYLKGMVTGKGWNPNAGKDKKDILTDAIVSSGAFGQPGNEAMNLWRGSQYHTLPAAATGTILGPTGSFGVETFTNVNKAISGTAENGGESDTKPLVKQITRSIPAVGKLITNIKYPSAVTKESEQYFKAKGDAFKTLKGDTKSKADFSTYFARSRDKDTNATIRNSPADSLRNGIMLARDDKLRGSIKQFETSLTKHDPVWDLPDDKLKIMQQYKSYFTGSAEKAFAMTNNPWIKDVQAASSKYYKDNPPPKGSKPSVASDQTPTYPEFDANTQKLLDTYSTASDADQKAITQQYGTELSNAYEKIGDWTNKMRIAEGAPALKAYPKADDATKAVIATYNALPKGDGKKGGNATRFAWAQANPDKYKLMQDYYTATSMNSLVKNAAKAQFAGSDPNQQLLKDIKNVGKYDIAEQKDASGKSVYSLNPQLAYEQSKGSGGFSFKSDPGAGLRNPYRLTVKGSSGKIRNAKFSVSYKKAKKYKVRIKHKVV